MLDLAGNGDILDRVLDLDEAPLHLVSLLVGTLHLACHLFKLALLVADLTLRAAVHPLQFLQLGVLLLEHSLLLRELRMERSQHLMSREHLAPHALAQLRLLLVLHAVKVDYIAPLRLLQLLLSQVVLKQGLNHAS